jgi:hypothetical protein
MSKKVNKAEPKSLKFNVPEWSWFVLFGLTTLIMFWQQLTGSAFFWEDFVEYVFPVQSFAASEFAKGIIPFWNPYSFNGMPFFADMQVGFFYPLNRLLSLFVSNGELSIWGLQFMTIVHFFIAQVSMFYLARQYKISNYGAALSAVSFAFSFILVLHVIHPMMLFIIAWFPLVLKFYIQALDEKNIRSGIFAGLIFGISMLAGHPQTTLYLIFFMGLMLIWKLIFQLKDAGNTKLKMIIAGLVPFLIAAGIFQIQYLPTAELADLSQRSEMTYEASAEGSMEFKQILTTFAPKIYGSVAPDNQSDVPFHLMDNDKQSPYFYYWETGFYFGIAALIFGLFAIFINNKDKKVLFLIIAAAFGLLYSLGDNFILHKLFYNLPLFGGFRNPARMMMFVVIAFSLLSGIGLDAVIKGDKKNYKSFIIAVAIPFVIGLAISAGLFTADYIDPKFASEVNGKGIAPILISLLILIFGFFAFNKKINGLLFSVLVIIITFIDLASAGSVFNQSSQNPEDKYKIDTQLAQTLSPDLPNEIFRANTRMYNPSYMAMNRNTGLVKRIMLVEGYNPLVLQKVTPPMPDAESVHDILNVKYELGIDQQLRQPVFMMNEDMYPRAWIVHDYQVFNNDEEIKDAMSSAEVDPLKTASLIDDPEFAKSEVSSELPIITEYNSNYIKIEVNASAEGLLCLSEIYYPAWKAYSNGNEVEIFRANYSLRAIPVKKGKQTIELKYQSSAFKIGAWLSIITLLLSVAGLFVLRRNQSSSGNVKSNVANTGQ